MRSVITASVPGRVPERHEVDRRDALGKTPPLLPAQRLSATSAHAKA
jgi:hypothetical protein